MLCIMSGEYMLAVPHPFVRFVHKEPITTYTVTHSCDGHVHLTAEDVAVDDGVLRKMFAHPSCCVDLGRFDDGTEPWPALVVRVPHTVEHCKIEHDRHK